MNPRILLVDDEREYVATLSERLGYRNIDAQWVSNAQDALKLIGEQNFDIAVLDVKMPSMGGIELKEKIKVLAPDMKFIFVTGHGSEEDYNECSADSTCYLIKPVDIEELMKMIQTTMGMDM